MKSSSPLLALKGHTHYVLCVSTFVGSDGNPRIVSGSSDFTLKVWNGESGLCEQTLQGHTDWLTCVSVFMGSDSLPRIVSGSGDTTMKVWDAVVYDMRSVVRGLKRKLEELEVRLMALEYSPGENIARELKKDFDSLKDMQ